MMAALGVLISAALRGPMLVDIKSGPLSGSRMLNPLRGRSPERFGSKLLNRIQSGDCQQTLAKVEIPDDQKLSACAKQATDPLKLPCQLVEREDNNNVSWLLFKCHYLRATDARAEVALTLHRTAQSWAISSYERIY